MWGTPKTLQSDGSNQNSTYKWWVPVTYTSESSKDFEDTLPLVWMNPSQETLKIEGI